MAISGQDKVNWTPTDNISSQASPMVSSPPQSLYQYLNVSQMKGWSHNSPRQTSHSCICSQMRSGPGAPQMKLTGPWPQEPAHSHWRELTRKEAVISHSYG